MNIGENHFLKLVIWEYICNENHLWRSKRFQMWILWKIISNFPFVYSFWPFKKPLFHGNLTFIVFCVPSLTFFIIIVERMNYHSHHLKIHIKTIHKCQKDFKCDSCGKSFSHSHHLRIHIKTNHKGHKDFKCDACGNFHWDIESK